MTSHVMRGSVCYNFPMYHPEFLRSVQDDRGERSDFTLIDPGRSLRGDRIVERSAGKAGFTLIELLVVIAIVAVLAVVVVLVLNPAQLLQQARDSNRLSDLATVNAALGYLKTDQPAATLGNSSTSYISVFDLSATSTAGDQCQGLGLLSLGSSSWQCAASSTYRSSGGTGWVPVALTNVSYGTPLAQLPVDPINVTSSGLFYTYSTNGSQYEVTSGLESIKYKLQFSSNPQISGYPEVAALGSSLSLSPLWNASGLVGYWPLDEGAGSTTVDQSGNGNNGIWTGTPINGSYYASGKVGNSSANVNGTNSYATVPSSTLHQTTFTVAAWVNPVNLRNSNDLIFGDFNTTATRFNYALSIDRSGLGSTPYIEFSNNAGTIAVAEDSVAAVGNTWMHLAGTFDGATLKLYRNGVLATSSATALVPSNQGGAMDIGRGGDYTGNLMFQGLIDDMRVYSRALSAGEIQALYNSER